MASKRNPKRDPARRATKRYRERMSEKGLRLVQVWVPDSRVAGFEDECRRQSRIIARNTRHEKAIMDWLDVAQDTRGWT